MSGNYKLVSFPGKQLIFNQPDKVLSHMVRVSNIIVDARTMYVNLSSLLTMDSGDTLYSYNNMVICLWQTSRVEMWRVNRDDHFTELHRIRNSSSKWSNIGKLDDPTIEFRPLSIIIFLTFHTFLNPSKLPLKTL